MYGDLTIATAIQYHGENRDEKRYSKHHKETVGSPVGRAEPQGYHRGDWFTSMASSIGNLWGLDDRPVVLIFSSALVGRNIFLFGQSYIKSILLVELATT